MRKSMFLASILLVFLASRASAIEPTFADRYETVRVESFDVQSGVDFRADYLSNLQQELVTQLQETHKVKSVLRAGEKPATETPVLCLSGTVTGFKPGSRAKRYFGGFGAGSAQIFAHVIYRDAASGQTLMEEEVVGTLSGGVFGGDSSRVSHEFAKSLVSTTKLVLLKTLPKPGAQPANATAAAGAENVSAGTSPDAAAPAPAAPRERKTLAITSEGLDTADNKLNELAAGGYRVVKFSVTGNKSADVVMERNVAPGEAYSYRVLHARLAGNVEKNMNKSAAEGYRYVRNSLSTMGGLSVLMEKPPIASPERYEYRFQIAAYQSNAEKNVREGQAKGFELVDAGSPLGVHIVVMEKAAAK